MFIADRWNFVYDDLMGRSVFMMLMFGWGLFLLPIVFVLSVTTALVKSAWRLND